MYHKLKGKWCPHVRIGLEGHTENDTRSDIAGEFESEEPDSIYRCIGKNCSAYRMDGTGHEWCGLAGPL